MNTKEFPINMTKFRMMYPSKEQREALRIMSQIPEVAQYARERYQPQIDKLKEKREIVDAQIDKWYAENWKSANLYKMEKEKSRTKGLYVGFIDYQINFLEKYLLKFRPTAKNKGAGWVDKEEIERARQFPIDSLMDIPRGNKICCLWHDEKTPSLSYNKNGNYLYCFGQCGRAYSSIDLYQKLNNCDFVTAVKALNNS